MEHGFQKGSGRVGRTRTLEDRLKVQLAVNAHIRHRLTPYESILAANKGEDAKLVARNMVCGRVKAIADSWRAASSPDARLSAPRSSAATHEGSRQWRAQKTDTQTLPADESQVLEAGLDGLCLDESDREASIRAMAARPLTAERQARREGRKEARRVRNEKTFLDSFRQLGLGPSKSLSKKQRKESFRLKKEERKRSKTVKYPQDISEDQSASFTMKPMQQEEIRKLRIAANRMESETTQVDEHKPIIEPGDEQNRKSPLLRNDYPIFDNGPVESDTLSDSVQLERRLRSSYKPTRSPSRSPSIERPSQTRYSLRSSQPRTSDLDMGHAEGPSPFERSISGDRLMVEDSEWMDVDDKRCAWYYN